MIKNFEKNQTEQQQKSKLISTHLHPSMQKRKAVILRLILVFIVYWTIQSLLQFCQNVNQKMEKGSLLFLRFFSPGI